LLLGLYFVRTITGPVVRVIRGLAETVEQFSEAASQVAVSSNTLAEGASRQTAAVEEAVSLARSLERENRAHSSNVQELVPATHDLDNQHQQIADEIGKVAARMPHIKAISEETSGILHNIQTIAFQTNLLALNASVEAPEREKRERDLP